MKGEAAEDVLRKGFTSTPKSKDDTTATTPGGMRWDDWATEWQIEVERWIIDDKRAGDMAKRAFISHVRAYATHVVKERPMFDVKALHLGHLAKAFGLRDRPGNMGRGTSNDNPSGRRGQGEKRKSKSGDDTGTSHQADFDVPATEGQDAARKMRKKMKEQNMAGASEFNIG